MHVPAGSMRVRFNEHGFAPGGVAHRAAPPQPSALSNGAESWGYLPPTNNGEEKDPEPLAWEERNPPQRPEGKSGRKKPWHERTAAAKARSGSRAALYRRPRQRACRRSLSRRGPRVGPHGLGIPMDGVRGTASGRTRRVGLPQTPQQGLRLAIQVLAELRNGPELPPRASGAHRGRAAQVVRPRGQRGKRSSDGSSRFSARRLCASTARTELQESLRQAFRVPSAASLFVLAKTSVPMLGEWAACLPWLEGSHGPCRPERSQAGKLPMHPFCRAARSRPVPERCSLGTGLAVVETRRRDEWRISCGAARVLKMS